MSLSQDNANDRRLHWKACLLCLLGIALTLVMLLFPGPSMRFDSEPVHDFGANWELLDVADASSAPRTLINLPTRVETNQTVRIAKLMPQGISYPAVLGFRTAHQKVRLYCGGELLYSFGYDGAPLLGKSPGSVWNIVRLPQHVEGQKVVIELSSPYRGYVGKIGGIQIGSKVALIFALLRTYTFSFIITLIILVAALVTLIVDFVIIRKDVTIGKETFYLGLFALFVSLWLFGEGRLTQFFGVSPTTNTCFVFLWMLATPIPLIQYIACGRSTKQKKILNFTTTLLCVLFGSSILLQLFNVVDFIEQVVFIHTCLILACGVMLYTVLVDMVRAPCAESFRLAGSIGILALCLLLETVGVYTGSNHVGNMMRMGVLIFIVMQAQEAFKKASRMMQLSRLASVDTLTGCLNRTAYNQRWKELEGQRNGCLVIADINDLKFINDNYGHETGDDAIVRCAQCFSEAFLVGGSCYRIGGDEFVMLGKSVSSDGLALMGSKFEALVKLQHAQVQYPFAVSYGGAVYDPHSDTSLSDVLTRADQTMYANKRHCKQCETQETNLD